MRAPSKPSLALALLALTACGTEAIVHNLEEKEANQIVELLAESEISGQKQQMDSGRSVVYNILVPANRRIEAIRLLNRYEMPRRRDMGYNEIFKEGGLIPTAAEEKSKTLAALEGEIEKQIKLVDGILDVQVNIVQPEESALRTAQDVRSPTTASVTIKYMPGPNNSRPLYEEQIRHIVAAAVERLTPENVVVVMTEGGPMVRQKKTEAEPGNSALHGLDKQARVIGFVAAGLIVALAMVIVASQMRLRTVRGRLVRLQAEIAKARRKGNSDNGGLA